MLVPKFCSNNVNSVSYIKNIDYNLDYIDYNFGDIFPSAVLDYLVSRSQSLSLIKCLLTISPCGQSRISPLYTQASEELASEAFLASCLAICGFAAFDRLNFLIVSIRLVLLTELMYITAMKDPTAINIMANPTYLKFSDFFSDLA